MSFPVPSVPAGVAQTPRDRRSFAPVVAAVLFGTVASARAAPPGGLDSIAGESSARAAAAEEDLERARLARRLATLEETLEDLEASGADDWLTRRRAEQITDLALRTIADAETRTGWQGAQPTAGYDDGFFIADADGRFRLEMSGQVQVRYVANRQRHSPEDNWVAGFENRRTKVKFEGYVLGPDVSFTLGTSFNRRTGELNIQGANVRVRLDDSWILQVGRARPPLLREEEVSSRRQLAAERSLIDKAFGQDRSTGVTLRYQDRRARLAAGVSGLGGAVADDQGWRLSGRAELLLRGGWGELKDFTSFPDDDPVVMIGGGLLYRWFDLASPDPDDEDRGLRWTLDASVEVGGATFFAAFVANHAERADGDRLDQFGAVVQAGAFLNEHWEIFGRYAWGEADEAGPALSVIELGVNRYVQGHALKWTADIGFGLHEVGDFWSSSGASWCEDRPRREGQIVLRLQLQLLF